MVKLMAMHSRVHACTKKLSPTEGSPTVALSQGYINGSENMGASHMEDEQVGPNA
jgi:hypothetical protein